MVAWPAWLPNLNPLISFSGVEQNVGIPGTWESRYWTEHTQRDLTMAWGLVAHMQSQKVVSLN